MLSKRLTAFLAAPLLMLGGCTTIESIGDHAAATVGLGDDQPKSYTSSAESTAKRSGTVVSDEPLATRSGAAILATSGNAVDAVTTMFFTLTATYPVAAGLGGGGICLVREAGGRVTEFDFLARGANSGGAFAVPGAVRGFADMQKQFGALPWQRVVAPGEAYAATGFPISQALSARLAAAQNVVRLDADLAAEFLDQAGQPRSEGAEVRNAALGQTIGLIRRNGADGFYQGVTAARISAYAATQGGAITPTELAQTRALSGSARSRNMGSFTAYLPGARTGAGVFAAAMLDNLSRARGDAAIAGAIRQTEAGFGVGGLPGDLGSTGFAAVDVDGQAASCAVTLNGPFGSGRTASDTGVQLASSPSGTAGLANAFLAPVLATDRGGAILAGAGAGGPNGTAAAAIALLQASSGRALSKRGDLRGTGRAPFDTVNMISCTTDTCVALADPGAHGSGAVAETVGQ